MGDRLEEYLQQLAADAEAADAAGKPPIRRLLGTVMDGCGWTRRSDQRIKALHDELAQAGLHASPTITKELRTDDWIRFSTKPPPEMSGRFENEKELEDFIERAHPFLFAGHEGLQGATLEDRQARSAVDGEIVIPDLLFRARDGVPIVVELKVGGPTLGSLEQLELYMRAEGHPDAPVRGVLITGTAVRGSRRGATERGIDRRLAEGMDVRWLTYDRPSLLPGHPPG